MKKNQVRGIVFVFNWAVTQFIVQRVAKLSFQTVPWLLWHISFGIFIFKLFTSPSDEDRWPVGPTVGSISFGLTALKVQETSAKWNVFGSAICLIGIAIVGAGSEYLGEEWRDAPPQEGAAARKRSLVKSGPYSVIRHPIYAGLLTQCLGSVVSGGFSSIVAITALVCSFTAYSIQLNQEEEELIKLFGEEYKRYKKQTSKLVPYLY